MKAEELKQVFISDYMPHIDKDSTYPFGEEEQRVWLKRLDTLLDEYAAEAEKRGIERGKIIGEHGCESWIE